MCGLSGIASPLGAAMAPGSAILAMRDSMVHRGPDDAGHQTMEGIALGSRRLAILDLSERGRMPMKTPDGRFTIVYNGEIYNYRELRTRLRAHGHSFVSDTDTEVLLRLFANDGPAMLSSLNGMFAMAIWDAGDRSLFLARDRLGIKPLYYALHEGCLLFASEQKALFAAGMTPRFDVETWEELLCFRYVAGERTPFEGVKRLLPGHYLLWKDGTLTDRRWWHLGEQARALRDSPPVDPAAWYRETFDSSVNLRRISDVPIGVLLSGGLDSGSVAASLALQAPDPIASFTVRFEEPGYDEGRLAQTVARRWRLEPHELVVPRVNFAKSLLEASFFNDEPLAHGNDLHLLAIARFAKPRVTVLLSGEGGDETLGGYVRYRPLAYPRLLGAARTPLGRAAMRRLPGARSRKLLRLLDLGSLEACVLFNACEILPPELETLGAPLRAGFEFRRRVLEEATLVYPNDPLRQAMYSDQHTFLCSVLDRNDRMTMAASIECRVPFLDYRLVEGLAALPSSVLLAGRGNKPLLRRSMRGRLPFPVLRHRKWGFGVPWKTYMREVPAIRDRVAGLPAAEPVRSGPFDTVRLARRVAAFLQGDDEPAALMRQLLMIAAWHEACVQGRPALSRHVS